MKQLGLAILILVLVASCKKEEIPIEPFDRGSLTQGSVFMEQDYRYQVWYDLKNNLEVGRNLRTEWDIAFSSSEDRVILNYSNMALAANGKLTSLENAWESSPNLEYRPDMACGVDDSLALKDILKSDTIYFVDRGFDPDGTPIGNVAIQVSLTEGGYQMKYRIKGESRIRVADMKRDSSYNYIYWSFEDHSQKVIEPTRESYDLCFTMYTNMFYDPVTPYLVNGVFINSYNTIGYQDSTTEFNGISVENLKRDRWTDHRDVVGFEWKDFDFDNASYVIYSEKNYIIRNSQGYYFKLHFTDFYNEKGEKGNPVFEYQLL